VIQASHGLAGRWFPPSLSDMLAVPPLASIPALAAALQEWAACCQALLSGRLILVVRKGGIHECQGGGFTLAHARFALLPTHAHQRAERLQGEIAALGSDALGSPPAGSLAVAGWAQAAGVWKVGDLSRIIALVGELAFTRAELEARFRYRDQPWLHVVALRVHRLAVVQCIPDLPRYAGCVSWIDLAQGIDPSASQAVLDERSFSARLDQVGRILGSAPSPALAEPARP
jgi:hypothetical protein